MATLAAWKYQEDWDVKLATRLDRPQNWKEVCDVRYMKEQTIILPYISAGGEPAVSTSHFAAATDRSDTTKVIPLRTVTQSTESLTIVTTDFDSVYIDFADEAQSRYANQMQLADLLGKKLGERVETIILANHAAWTDMGDDGAGNPALSTTAFTVTNSNVDDLIRGVKEQINTANGATFAAERGIFTVWRPADITKLEAFMQANGYSYADQALKDGFPPAGKYTMGMYHYMSTSHASGHLMAGVRGAQLIGVQSSTFGKTYEVEHPASSTAGNLSGSLIYWRLDYGLKVQTNILPVVYDINVA